MTVDLEQQPVAALDEPLVGVLHPDDGRPGRPGAVDEVRDPPDHRERLIGLGHDVGLHIDDEQGRGIHFISCRHAPDNTRGLRHGDRVPMKTREIRDVARSA